MDMDHIAPSLFLTNADPLIWSSATPDCYE